MLYCVVLFYRNVQWCLWHDLGRLLRSTLTPDRFSTFYQYAMVPTLVENSMFCVLVC